MLYMWTQEGLAGGCVPSWLYHGWMNRCRYDEESFHSFNKLCKMSEIEVMLEVVKAYK